MEIARGSKAIGSNSDGCGKLKEPPAGVVGGWAVRGLRHLYLGCVEVPKCAVTVGANPQFKQEDSPSNLLAHPSTCCSIPLDFSSPLLAW